MDLKETISKIFDNVKKSQEWIVVGITQLKNYSTTVNVGRKSDPTSGDPNQPCADRIYLSEYNPILKKHRYKCLLSPDYDDVSNGDYILYTDGSEIPAQENENINVTAISFKILTVLFTNLFIDSHKGRTVDQSFSYSNVSEKLIETQKVIGFFKDVDIEFDGNCITVDQILTVDKNIVSPYVKWFYNEYLPNQNKNYDK